MFSPILFRFSNSNSCMILLFFFSYFHHHVPCALSQSDLRFCDTMFHCGNITAGFPFWGGARPEPCGHPSLGLHCSPPKNQTFFIISGQMYRILHINNSTNNLGLARQDFLAGSFCNSTFTGTTLTPELFQLPPEYTTLSVYYLCEPHLPNPASFTCPQTGAVWVRQSNENHENCAASFNITVPTSYVPEEESFNLTRLLSVLKEGFEMKLKIDKRPCQECKSTGGICGYDRATPVCCKTNSSSTIECSRMLLPSGSSGPSEPAKKELTKAKKLGIGFACGFLGVTILAATVLCYRRRMKLAAQYTSKDLSTTSTYTTMKMGNGVACGFLGYRKRETSHHPRDQKLKALLQLKQYSYAEVKKITKSFSHTVGRGGFGTVYGGNLCNGRKVAVKVLKDFKSNGEDFINEVASMSQTSHVNIVSLLGFCFEGSKRAIVYEFLENGSLDQFISRTNSPNLSISTLYGIALGVARGLEYLHHGCKTRIVHFDIKPQNVLLDDNLCPKVSDFGLAKLCEKRESILSLIDTRGTVGYIAPEVFSRMYGRVSHKSDVYSYGMLVLEMIGARNKETVKTDASDSSSTYFPDWIYKDLENGEHTSKFGDELTRQEKEIVKKITLVGLWCIQPCPSNRPPMNKVVEMMEGSLETLEVPPKPSLHLSEPPLAESSWLSEKNSNYSESEVL